MPQMSGAELAATVKEKWPELPFVVATGYAELDPGQGQSLPRLSKPFNEAQLKEAIERVFRPRTVITFPKDRSAPSS